MTKQELNRKYQELQAKMDSVKTQARKNYYSKKQVELIAEYRNQK